MKHFYEKLNYKCSFEDFIKESKNEMLQLNIAGHNKNVLWVKENNIDAQIVHNYQISKFKLYIDNAIKLIK
jgi:ABC-type phosphate/phosphonate transport system substrate-binding protein